MFATSSEPALAAPSNQASRISSSSASLVERSDSASTFASFHLRAPRAVSASPHKAARTPGTLLAAIDAPVPVQQHTTAWSAAPSTTSRAAASLAHAQSSRSPSAQAPCSTGAWPRLRSSSTPAPAQPVRPDALHHRLGDARSLVRSNRHALGAKGLLERPLTRVLPVAFGVVALLASPALA